MISLVLFRFTPRIQLHCMLSSILFFNSNNFLNFVLTNSFHSGIDASACSERFQNSASVENEGKAQGREILKGHGDQRRVPDWRGSVAPIGKEISPWKRSISRRDLSPDLVDAGYAAARYYHAG